MTAVQGRPQVVVDPDVCVCSVRCMGSLPDVFVPDDEGMTAVRPGAAAPLSELLEVARTCPVGAITVLDAGGVPVDPWAS